jgi:hypothetical protein
MTITPSSPREDGSQPQPRGRGRGGPATQQRRDGAGRTPRAATNTLRYAALGALAIAPITLAACSSSAKTSNAAPAGSHGPAGTGGAAAARTTAAASSAGPAAGAPAGLSGNICSDAVSKNPLLLDLTAGDQNPAGDDRQKVLTDMQKIADEAPSDVKGDLEEVISYLRTQLASASKSGGQDDNSVPDDPKLDAAMQHYGDWINAHCGGGQ